MEQETVKACPPFFHKYTRWTQTGDLTRSRDQAHVGQVFQRVCVRCGRVKQLILRID